MNYFLFLTCLHAQMAAIHCSLGEMGVVHISITHTISSSGKLLEYGAPQFFERWTGPFNAEWSILPTFCVKWTIW